MVSRIMMAAVVGTIYATPSAPSAINIVSAASGPYAAELSASSPKMGMPAAGPMRSPVSSQFASGLPSNRSRKDINLCKHGRYARRLDATSLGRLLGHFENCGVQGNVRIHFLDSD